MSNKLDKSLILNDIKLYYNFSSDTDFANFLGVKPQTLSSWRVRNTFDIELMYAKCVNIDANFLLTGKGNMIRENNHSKSDEGDIKDSFNNIKDFNARIYNKSAVDKGEFPDIKDQLLEKDKQLSEKDKQIGILIEQQSKFLEQIDKLVDQQSKLISKL